MDTELRQYLEAMEARMEARMDARMEAMEARFDGKLEAMEARFDGKLQAMEHRLKEHMDGRIDASEERMKDFVRNADFELETKLVSEFWKWGRSSDIRVREATADAAAVVAKAQMISERLMIVEERVSALERERGAA